MTQRYYFSRKPSQTEGGVYKIFDRVLDIRIASCDFKENAELLVTAANTALQLEAENKLLRERPAMADVVRKVVKLQDEIDRMKGALLEIEKGPPPLVTNAEVAGWAVSLAQMGLRGV